MAKRGGMKTVGNGPHDAARWQAVLAKARDAIVSIDASGHITLFNPAAEEMFGYTADDVLGRNVSLLMPNPYRDDHDRYIRAYQDTREPKAIGRIRDVFGRRRNGDVFPIELSVSESMVDGEPLYTAIIRDVTAQRRMQLDLQRERDFARSVIDTAQVILVLLDPTGRITLFNPYMEQLSGYRLDEVVGRCWFATFLPADEVERARLVFDRTLKSGKPCGHIGTIRTRHFGERSIEWYEDLLRDPEGAVLGVLCSGLDITEHLRTQQEIRTRERQQAAVARLGRTALLAQRVSEFIDEAVLIVRDTLEVEFAKILEFLPERGALRVISGAGWEKPVIGAVTGAEEPTSHVAEVLKTNRPAILDDLRQQLQYQGSLFLSEHGVVSGVGVSIAGRARPFGVLAAYTRTRRAFSEDDVTFMQSIANVVAEAIARDRAEKDLLEFRREAQQRDRLADIGAITAKVVHDLGNPLAAISMQAQLLLRRAKRGEFEPMEPVIGPVEHCLTTVRRLQDLIKEFNDFARDQRVRVVDIRVGSLLNSLADLWRPLADARGIHIEVRLDEPLPAISADEDKLRRVLDNLVKNAIEAIDDGGDILITASVLDPEKIRITVEDSGSGVPEGFDVFRLFETTKRDGTGIGLAVAKQVVLAHGGKIEHRPRNPHGTVFEIDLPRSGPPQGTVQPLTP